MNKNYWNDAKMRFCEPLQTNVMIELGQPEVFENPKRENPKRENPKRRLSIWLAWLMILTAAAVVIGFLLTIAEVIRRFVI